MSCGSLARFSAQSVSMIPASGIFEVHDEAEFLPELLDVGQILSGVPATTSQRWVPERSTRILSICGSRSCAASRPACAGAFAE
jgi:hypothetical protein